MYCLLKDAAFFDRCSLWLQNYSAHENEFMIRDASETINNAMHCFLFDSYIWKLFNSKRKEIRILDFFYEQSKTRSMLQNSSSDIRDEIKNDKLILQKH